MTGKIIDGVTIANKVKETVRGKVIYLKEHKIEPCLAVILVGENPASKAYVNNKHKTCEQLGIKSIVVKLPVTVSQDKLLQEIEKLNQDDTVHGVLVQLPLPEHIDERIVIEAISPMKDVDGFHPVNVGKLLTGQDTFIPCTPYGIMVMLQEIGYHLQGKHAVVVGRSNIVGKPIGQLLLNQNATVTYVHSKTVDIEQYTKQADVLVVAVGKRNIITEKHVKHGAVVIDVGMNRDENGKLCGDVAFEEVKEIASYITPVPKGVGQMTVAMLMFNTVKSAFRKLG